MAERAAEEGADRSLATHKMDSSSLPHHPSPNNPLTYLDSIPHTHRHIHRLRRWVNYFPVSSPPRKKSHRNLPRRVRLINLVLPDLRRQPLHLRAIPLSLSLPVTGHRPGVPLRHLARSAAIKTIPKEKGKTPVAAPISGHPLPRPLRKRKHLHTSLSWSP